MYSVINANLPDILKLLSRNRKSCPNYHVAEYEWLLTNFSATMSPNYKDRYSNYWGMKRFFPSTALPAYFSLLAAASAHKSVPFASALMAFYPVTKQIEKSFISKLCHMCDPHLPIIDSYISKFYFSGQPPLGLSVSNQVVIYDGVHRFLQAEYKRVLKSGTLNSAIQQVRNHFSVAPSVITDEKIIDSLIWGLSKLKRVAGMGVSITIYPYIPILPSMTVGQIDGIFRRIKRELEKRIGQGSKIGKIVFRRSPNRIPLPDWFESWRQELGIEIVFIDNAISDEIIADKNSTYDWMDEAILESNKGN